MMLNEIKAKFLARVAELGCTWDDVNRILDPPTGFTFDREGLGGRMRLLDRS